MAKKIKIPKGAKLTRPCPSDCDACCRILSIEALKKPEREPCRFLEKCEGGNCRIWVRRPTACREFDCAWKGDQTIPEHLYPSASGLLVSYGAGRFGITVALDELEEDSRNTPAGLELLEHFIARGLLVVTRTTEGHRILNGPPDRVAMAEKALRARFGDALKVGG